MIEFLALPALACTALVAIHAYFGLHVLRRNVIFVDLALAQVAALGATAAFLLGHAPQGLAAHVYALAFTLVAAALLASTRAWSARVPQEAQIGVIYVVAAAAALLLVDRAPQGAEHIRQILTGNILTVGWEELRWAIPLYAAVGVGYRFLARRLDGRGWLSEFLFYAAFGVVVTSSVGLAGVLLVFAFLIIPAAIGVLHADEFPRQLAIAWVAGVATALVGLGVSYAGDFSTGATLVCTYGAALAVAGVAYGLRLPHSSGATFEIAGRLGRWVGAAVLAASAIWIVVSRRHPSDRAGQKQDRRRQQEWRARQMVGRSRIDECGEGLGEEARTEEPGDRGDARVGALQLPLLGRRHVARHERLRGSVGESPQRHHRDGGEEHRAGRGESVHHEAGCAEEESRRERAPLAQARHHRLHQRALHDHRAHADAGEHQAHLQLVPAVAISHVEHRDARQDDVRELHQESGHGEARELPMRAQQHQRTDRIGLGDAKRRAPIARQRFGQHEVAVGDVHQRHRAGHPEWQPRIDLAKDAAQRGTEDEAQPEGRAHHPEGPGARFRGRHVGDGGEGGGEPRGRDPRDHAPHEEPGEVRRERHEEIIAAEAEARDQHHGTAPESIRKGAHHRHEQELHQAPRGAEEPEGLGRDRGVAALEPLDHLRQHRDHDAQGEHVDHDRREDEDDRRAAGRGGGSALHRRNDSKPPPGASAIRTIRTQHPGISGLAWSLRGHDYETALPLQARARAQRREVHRHHLPRRTEDRPERAPQGHRAGVERDRRRRRRARDRLERLAHARAPSARVDAALPRRPNQALPKPFPRVSHNRACPTTAIRHH